MSWVNIMLQAERYKMICAHVQKMGAVRVTELSQLFQVSQETIRRDLTRLEKIRNSPAALVVQFHWIRRMLRL